MFHVERSSSRAVPGALGNHDPVLDPQSSLALGRKHLLGRQVADHQEFLGTHQK